MRDPVVVVESLRPGTEAATRTGQQGEVPHFLGLVQSGAAFHQGLQRYPAQLCALCFSDHVGSWGTWWNLHQKDKGSHFSSFDNRAAKMTRHESKGCKC